MSGILQAYLRHISGKSKVCLRYISGILQVNLRYKSCIFLAYVRYISGIYQILLRLSIMMPQSKKIFKQLARRKYGGTSDLLAKSRFKDGITPRNIIHKNMERKFEFAFNKLHEVLNKLEEKGVERELVSFIRN